MADERAIAAVLAAHEIVYGGEDADSIIGAICECGGWRNYDLRDFEALAADHRAHIVAAIAAIPGDDAARALARVEARVFAALRGHTCWHDPTLPEKVLTAFAEVRAAHAAGAEADGPSFGDYWPAEPEAGR